MSDPTNLPGPLGAYAAAFKANDVERMRQIVLDVVAADEIVLPHPENGVLCYCRSSFRWGPANLLFFSDEAGDSRWCLVQLANFFRLATTEASVIPITSEVPASIREQLIPQLRAGELDHYWNMRHDFDGLIVSHIRPYHYFYDQFIHLPDIVNNVPEKKTDNLYRRYILYVAASGLEYSHQTCSKK